MQPNDVQQGTEEWFAARMGKATASRFKDVLAVLKNGGEAAGRRNYRAQLVVERLTGISPERFSSAAMEWGSETEALARVEYRLKTGNKADEVGFIEHPKMPCGASPDGLIGADGTLEIKCRNTANHIETLKTDNVPAEYIPQIQGQLWLTGRKWADFVSFDPDMPPNAQLFIARVLRDDAYIEMLEGAVRVFLDEVANEVAFIQQYKGRPQPAAKPKKEAIRA